MLRRQYIGFLNYLFSDSLHSCGDISEISQVFCFFFYPGQKHNSGTGSSLLMLYLVTHVSSCVWYASLLLLCPPFEWTLQENYEEVFILLSIFRDKHTLDQIKAVTVFISESPWALYRFAFCRCVAVFHHDRWQINRSHRIPLLERPMNTAQGSPCFYARITCLNLIFVFFWLSAARTRKSASPLKDH